MINLAGLGKTVESFGNNTENRIEQFPKAFNEIKENKSGENTDAPVAKEDVGENTDVHENMITRNESLEGDVHPITGVPFERRVVEIEPGHTVEGVFPKFESRFDAQLPKDMYDATDNKQFEECNKQLKEAVHNDPELRKKFTPEQLEQIENGDTPDGYTWHHDATPGKMQLVDTETHAATGHTGGRNVWGGGTEAR